jgi:hypothetical protein
MIQDNWSHDNQGEGFLLLSWPIGFGYSRGESHNVQMRYNISERDGKKLAGGITIFGGVDPVVIYNNTIYYEPDRLAGTVMFNGEGGPLTTSIFGKSGKPNAKIFNNVFITDGRTNTAAVSNNLWTDGDGTFAFDNNIWWGVEGGLRFQWGGSPITTWSGWRANGFDASGSNANPVVSGPWGGAPGAYRLLAGSPAINRGRNVTEALRGMGTQDAFGAFTPQGAGYDIGACEHRLVTPDPGAALLARVSRRMDGSWQLDFSGLMGRSYRLESSADLRAWNGAGVATENTPGVFRFIDRNTAAERFYRAVVRGVPDV